MKRGLFILTALLSIIGCEQRDNTERGHTSVGLVVSIAEQGSDDTKVGSGAVTGSSFTPGNTFGMFICKENTYNEHSIGYNNMIAELFKDNVWRYSFEGGMTTFKSLFIVSDDYRTPADFYAYAPWIAKVTDPENIPFSVIDQQDMMYATYENPDGDVSNKSLSVDNKKHSVYLKFHHTLSLLEFCFRIEDEFSPLTLTNITIREVSSGAELYTGATMDAVHGTLKELKTDSDTISVDYDEVISEQAVGSYDEVRMLLIPSSPSATATDVYRVEFTFDGAEEPLIYDIPRSALLHNGSGTEIGFQPKYRYRFCFTIHNYLHLDGITIDTQWKAGTNKDFTV